MTIDQFLKAATARLQQAGSESPRLDALILLEDALERDRAMLLAHGEEPIPAELLGRLNKQITQRAQHVPLAYIRGKAAFYGRDFLVNTHVLVPRPETEMMITMLKTMPLPARPRLADIGTGSGCLGLTAALELPSAEVWLYDIDPAALRVAQQNAARLHAANTRCKQSDLLAKAVEHFDALLANLPYVPTAYPINQAARHEPPLALFSGDDGLDLYRRFWQQVAALHRPPRFVLTEALETQHKVLDELAMNAGYRLRQHDGLAQCFEQMSNRPA